MDNDKIKTIRFSGEILKKSRYCAYLNGDQTFSEFVRDAMENHIENLWTEKHGKLMDLNAFPDE